MNPSRRDALKMIAGAGGAALAVPWLGSCGLPSGGRTPPRLVLLHATCSVNAGYLGSYGGPSGLTPALDRFAAGSAVLEAHHSECGQSGVAYASILSGTQADVHAVFDHPSPLRPELDLITEVFAAAGYEVYYWGGHAMAGADLGYGQGVRAENNHPIPLTADDPHFAEILERLNTDPAYKAMVVTSFTATHMKYAENGRFFTDSDRSPDTLPDHFAALGLDREDFERCRDLLFHHTSIFGLCDRFDDTMQRWQLSETQAASFRASMDYLYRCAVHRLDRLFGELVGVIDSAGLTDHSLVVFTADHGEALYRDSLHFVYSHGYQLAPEVLRVPLIVRGYGVRPQQHAFVSRSIDLLPTIAGLAGVTLRTPCTATGVDLSAVLTGAGRPPQLAAYSHTVLVHTNIVNDPEYGHSTLHRLFPARDPKLMWVCVRHRNLMVKWTRPRPDGGFVATAFDLHTDPTEDCNIFDPANPEHQQALAALKRYKARLVGAWLEGPAAEGLEEAERIRRLEALGYLQG